MTLLYNTGLLFNTIHVIESLAQGQLRSGLELYDSILRPAEHANEGLKAEYHQVQTSNELTDLLRTILNESAEKNRGPILHFEAHGDNTGLALADGSHMPWTSLTPQLTSINRACQMNLLVVAMMCHGWDLTLALMPNERAPVFMLIGPPATLSAGAIEDGTKRFYSSLLTNWSLNEALESMNEEKPYEQWTIRPATAEILFCRVFRYYIQELATAANLQERENKLVADMARARSLSVRETPVLRQAVRQHLSDHGWWYDYLRHTFLMIDLFPKNARRFGLTYSKCVGGGP